MFAQTAQTTASIQYRVPGTAFFVGERERQIPYLPLVVKLSDFRPEDSIRTPSFIPPRWTATPAPFHSDDLLDWDFYAGPSPKRPSGTVTLMLEYVGRGFPGEVEDA
jgi:hypothetical protein